MFLQILGIIFLLIICVVAYFAWKIFRFVKTQQNSDIAIAMSILPSQNMELQPSNVGEWVERERLGFQESELKKIGAEHVGYYCVYSGYAIIRFSIWNVKHQAVAAIYEVSSEQDKSEVAFIYEVACKLPGGSICISSNQHATLDSRPKNHILKYKDSNSVVEFIKAIKPEIPKGEKILKIKDPMEFFVDCYEDTSEWSWRAEQITSEKTKQLFSSAGVSVTEELLQELVDLGQSYSVEINVNRARKKLAKHSKMTADQWEKIRDRLVFINDKMQVEHLVEAIYDLGGELSDPQEQALDGFQTNTEHLDDPMGAFQMLVQSLSLKAKRITSMEAPTKTEVYLPL